MLTLYKVHYYCFIISVSADQLDALITAVTEATHAPCSSEGYYIGIALVDSIPLAEELSTPMAGGTK